MSCRTIHKKLIFFLEGDLSKPEAEAVSAHLAQCPECAAFFEDMKKTLHILQEEKSPDINPFFYTRLRARMENEAEEVTRPAGFSLWERVLQPALFTMLLLAGIYAGMKIGHPANEGSNSVSYAETELIPYLNEMEAEPIESFLME